MNPSPRLPRRFSRLLIALLAIALIAPSTFARQSAAAAKAAPARSDLERESSEKIRVETIRDVTTALVSKEFEGRGTAQPGADKAARYIAARFSKIGLKPLGDESRSDACVAATITREARTCRLRDSENGCRLSAASYRQEF